jgi:hypothetical protein
MDIRETIPSAQGFRAVDFALALQLRLGRNGFVGSTAAGPCTKTSAVCDGCGTLLAPEFFDAHVIGCARRQTPNCYLRHNAIRDTFARFCRQQCLPHTLDPSTGDGTGQKADLAVYLPSAVLVADFVSPSPLAPSCPSVEAATRRKLKKYAALPGLGLLPVTPGVVAATGGMGRELESFVKTLAEEAPIPADAKRELLLDIAAAVQRSNGAILRVARLRAGLCVPMFADTKAVSENEEVEDEEDEVSTERKNGEEEKAIEVEDDGVPPVVSLPANSPLLFVHVTPQNTNLVTDEVEAVDREMEIVEGTCQSVGVGESGKKT